MSAGTLLVTVEDDQLQDFDTAKLVAEKLHETYPNHLWAVTVQDGAIIVKNMAISGQYGFVLHLTDVYADPTLKCAIKAGGELLERAHMRRGKWTGECAEVLEGSTRQHFRPWNSLSSL